MKRRKPESWVGTNIFDTATSAINYYRPYGKNGADVADMVHAGEIKIGLKYLRESYGDLAHSDFAINGDGRFLVKM